MKNSQIYLILVWTAIFLANALDKIIFIPHAIILFIGFLVFTFIEIKEKKEAE